MRIPNKKFKDEKVIMMSYVLELLNEFGVDIRDKSRKREIVDLVKIFCKYIHDKYKFSYSNIGAFLNRDHASVLYACKLHDDIYITDKNFKAKSDHVRIRFRSIDSENIPTEYKDKLYDIIEVCPENVRKDFYELIMSTEVMQRNIQKILNE